MKKPLVLAFTLLLAGATYCQKDKDIPDFGKIDQSELDLKDCDFDKDASAVVLFDVGEVFCNVTTAVTMERDRHVRIKILSDKGLDQADIHIPYYSYARQEYIKNLTAQTYNTDANGNIVVTKVDKKQIYDKKVSARYSEQVFTFPEVKAGSIIEYKYTVVGGTGDWYFQHDIPVLKSRFTLDFPTEIEVYTRPFCYLPVDQKKEDKGKRSIQRYTMQNIPGLHDEPYMTCDEDYLQHLDWHVQAIDVPGSPRHNMVPNWPHVIKDLMEDEDFGLQLKKNIPRTADLDAALAPITDPYQKMVTIYDYVRTNMEWNKYDNIWALDGVKAAWKDHKGTSGEINLILVNLLKDAGLNASPILLSTHQNGRVSTSDAYLYQFNKVMAYVRIGDNTYVLDGTDKYTPPNLIPESVILTEGLVISKIDTYEWGWQMLWDNSPLYKNVTVLNGSISEDGHLTGNAYIASYDYLRLNRMGQYRKDKEAFQTAVFTSNYNGLHIDSFEVKNEEDASQPFVQKFKFDIPVTTSGDYEYFSVNMFSGLDKNPFVADNRSSDVFFGAGQEYRIIWNFTVPPGYSFDELPKSIRMITPDTATIFTRQVAHSNTQLSVRIGMEFKKPFYTAQEYPEFKEFFKKMFSILEEQIVLKKNEGEE